MDVLYRVVVSVAQTVWKIQGTKFTITGEENLPQSGGYVLASNHIGIMDFTYCGLPVWNVSRRYARFMAKKEIFDNPIAGALMRGMHHIRVDRTDGKEAYETAVTYLNRGEVVGIFPEATISRSFDLREFKVGAAKMALETNTPLVPMALWGSQRVWTVGRRQFFTRAKIPINIAIGKPLTPEGSPEELTGKLKVAINELVQQVQAAYPQPQGAWWLPARLGGSAPTVEQVAQEDAARKAQWIRRQ